MCCASSFSLLFDLGFFPTVVVDTTMNTVEVCFFFCLHFNKQCKLIAKVYHEGTCFHVGELENLGDPMDMDSFMHLQKTLNLCATL